MGAKCNVEFGRITKIYHPWSPESERCTSRCAAFRSVFHGFLMPLLRCVSCWTWELLDDSGMHVRRCRALIHRELFGIGLTDLCRLGHSGVQFVLTKLCMPLHVCNTKCGVLSSWMLQYLLCSLSYVSMQSRTFNAGPYVSMQGRTFQCRAVRFNAGAYVSMQSRTVNARPYVQHRAVRFNAGPYVSVQGRTF